MLSYRIIFLAIFIICGALIASSSGIHYLNGSVMSSPQAIISAITMNGILLFLPKPKTIDYDYKPVGLRRRLIAGLIDLYIAMGGCLAVFVLFILIIEYFATGLFQWSYERPKFIMRDVLGFIMILGCFYGLYYYFYKHAEKGRATPGQYIMGYRIIPANTGEPKFGARATHAYITLCLWVFMIIPLLKVKDGIYPWDRKSHTRAVRIRIPD